MSLFGRIFGRDTRQVVTPAQALSCVAGVPMAMSPSGLDVLIAAAQAGGKLESDYPVKSADGGSEFSWGKYITEIRNGIGYVVIRGPLFTRSDLMTWWYGGTGYDAITEAVQLLTADAGVTAIVLDIDTYGGRVHGCFECARAIRAADAIKPVTAFVNDAGFSAGYALACAARRVVLTQTAGVGSIGVISAHVDYSRMLEGAGIKYTLVFAGEKKADLTPTAPISDRARADLQAEVDRLGELFYALVAEFRGIDVDAVRAMQAGAYFGPAAVAIGLADEVGGIEAATRTQDPDAEESQPPAQPADTEPDAVAPDPVPPAPSLTAEQLAAMDRAAVADALASCKLPPQLVTALIQPSAGVSAATVAERIEHARAVHDACYAAGLPEMAADYVSKGASLEIVRAQLIAAKAEDGPELVTNPPQRAAQTSGPSATSIRSRYRTAAAGHGQSLRRK